VVSSNPSVGTLNFQFLLGAWHRLLYFLQRLAPTTLLLTGWTKVNPASSNQGPCGSLIGDHSGSEIHDQVAQIFIDIRTSSFPQVPGTDYGTDYGTDFLKCKSQVITLSIVFISVTSRKIYINFYEVETFSG
jgi:hypothetical protein